jgi:hypothetical protein
VRVGTSNLPENTRKVIDVMYTRSIFLSQSMLGRGVIGVSYKKPWISIVSQVLSRMNNKLNISHFFYKFITKEVIMFFRFL